MDNSSSSSYYYCITGLVALLLAWTLVQGFILLVGKLPPGPFPLPIIGNLHLLGNKPHKSLAELANFYGPIMCLRLGQITTLVISSSDMAKQVLQKQDLAFSSRSIPDFVQIDNFHMFSLSWLPVSPQWRNLRKILNSHIFSINKLDASQHLRYKKVEELVGYCERSSQMGEAVDIGGAIFRTLLNLLSNTLFSKDMADPYVNSGKEFKNLVKQIMMDLGKPNMVDYFPVLKLVDPLGLRRYNSRFGKLLKLFEGLINERVDLRKSQNDQKSSDVLDDLLSASEHNPQHIHRKHIATIILDLFVAGTDTSSNIVEWAMAEILKGPEIMKKAQAELAEVIGEGKAIEEADVARLPYLQCIIKETFRLHPPAPFSVPRKVEQDVELCGYTVPKGSKVLINVWAIGRDSTFWENPLVFNPDRFKDSKLDVRGQDFELIPFGAGRRICPGLPLAIRMVPVMLGTLLNTFKWKIEGDIAPKDLDMEDKFGLTLAKLHPLRAVPLPL